MPQQLIRDIASLIGGSGGGRSDFAQAGGNKPENFEKAFEKLKNIIVNEIKMKIIRFNSKKLEKIYNRGFNRSKRVEEKVRQIIEDVRIFGDEALIKYTKKFDGVKLSPKQLKVSEIEISGAYQNISPEFCLQLKNYY